MALDPGSDGVPIGISHLTEKRRIRGGHKAYITTSTRDRTDPILDTASHRTGREVDGM